MANPQKEDGYTPIANEILEHLYNRYLSPNKWQIVIYIIRKTYGFGKKLDYITNSQIITETGLCKTTVSRALKELSDGNYITRKGKFIGFQKDWEQWKKLADRATKVVLTANKTPNEKLADTQQKLADTQLELADRATKVSSPLVTQKKKETYTKETIQKKEKKPYGEFLNILLTDNEVIKLKERFGEKQAREMVQAASESFQSHKDYPRKYSDHYATILSWARMDAKRGNNGHIPEPRPSDRYTDGTGAGRRK